MDLVFEKLSHTNTRFVNLHLEPNSNSATTTTRYSPGSLLQEILAVSVSYAPCLVVDYCKKKKNQGSVLVPWILVARWLNIIAAVNLTS